ncbi:5-formyltetrahydrofolate cyclo-ligase, partial [Treponema sp. R6D11]
MISDDTIIIHFEKASAEIRGSFVAINKLHCEKMMKKYPELKYVNREDDSGIQGLRKAKLSYFPDFFVEKYSCTPKSLIKKQKESFRKLANKKPSTGNPYKEICALDEYKNANSIFVYHAMPSEIPTDELIEKMIVDGKKVSIPAIFEGEMFAAKFDNKLTENLG